MTALWRFSAVKIGQKLHSVIPKKHIDIGMVQTYFCAKRAKRDITTCIGIFILPETCLLKNINAYMLENK